MPEYEMLCCIINHGHGSGALKIAKRHGVTGGTICLCRGTVKSKLLDILDIHDTRKELVMMIAEKAAASQAAEALAKEFAFHKRDHGVAFSIPLSNFIGTKNCEFKEIHKPEGVNGIMISAIFTVVDKGLGEEVMEAANAAGARGGTIINARGSGINDTEVLFAMPIEPEKEVVLILAENKITEQIAASIRKNLHIDESGNGIMFIMGVEKAYGLYE